MKYPYLIGTLCTAIFSFIISPANAGLVTVTFDSLEINDSGTHNMSSYTEAGLTFTGPDSGQYAGTGVFHDGQLGVAYQGSAAIFVAEASMLIIEAQPGKPMLDLVSLDFADLCGYGEINAGRCHDPAHDIYFRLTTYSRDSASFAPIATQDYLVSTGVSGGFNTFSIPSMFVGFGVDRIEITAQSGNPAYLQIDNLVFEPSAVPVPAAIWLFGSGLLGLVGISRRNKAV